MLDTFTEQRAQQTLSEIARRARLPVATAHRLIGELCKWGALEQTSTQQYVIGRKIWELALLSPVPNNIIEIASPYMQDVLYETQGVVNLFVRDGSEVLLVTRISGTNVGDPLSQAGRKLPLHASAAGKVLLAYGSEALRARIRDTKLQVFTKQTISSHERLAQELHAVRQQGYAITNEELGAQNFGIAVPVMEHSSVRMALGVVLKTAPHNPGLMVSVLRIAARAIARKVEQAGFSVDGFLPGNRNPEA